MPLYTAQFRYSGPDRLDITVKSSNGALRIFAPTWKMVTDYKNHGDKFFYTSMYNSLLLAAIEKHRNTFQHLHNKATEGDATLVCYCPAENFCHRLLLAEFMYKHFETILGGERCLKKQ